MSELKLWALMLLFLSAGAFVLFHLLPSGNLSKTAKSVMAALCMAAVFIPLFRVFGNGFITLSDFSGTDMTDTDALYEYYRQSAERTVSDTVALVTEKFGVRTYILETDTDITDNGCIDIKRVLITLDERPANIQDFAAALKDVLGLAPEIEVKQYETAVD